MNKKIIAIILILVLILSGCSNKVSIDEPTNLHLNESEKEQSDLNDPLVIAEVEDNLLLYSYKGEILAEGENQLFYFYNDLAVSTHPEGKVGFVNREGTFIINPIYEDALPFSKNGLAAVCITNDNYDRLWGYINEKGETIIPFQYKQATAFYENGYAKVQLLDNQVAVIDNTGKVCFSSEVDSQRLIINEQHIISPKVILNYSGKPIETATENEEFFGSYKSITKLVSYNETAPSEAFLYQNGKFTKASDSFKAEKKMVPTTASGYAWELTLDGERLLPIEYDAYEIYGSHVMLYKYGTAEGKGGTVDIFNINTTEITATNLPYDKYSFRYHNYTSMMPEGYFIVSVQNPHSPYSEDRHFGVIDAYGNIIVPLEHISISPYSFEHFLNF